MRITQVVCPSCGTRIPVDDVPVAVFVRWCDGCQRDVVFERPKAA